MKTTIFLMAVLALTAVLFLGTVAETYAETGSASSTRETIPTFCDSSSDHGASTSCKAEAEVIGYTCQNGGTPGKASCSVGQACSENGNPGNWCMCTINCIRSR